MHALKIQKYLDVFGLLNIKIFQILLHFPIELAVMLPNMSGLVCFQWVLFLKISENKPKQMTEPQPQVSLDGESSSRTQEHIWLLQHWLTGCVWQSLWTAWIADPVGMLFCWRYSGKAIMGYLLLCSFVLFWYREVRRFPRDKKWAGSWLWLTAQNIETIIHWDHLCQKRNLEIFSPWGFSCKRLLLFVLILVCKFFFSFSLLAHSANYK